MKTSSLITTVVMAILGAMTLGNHAIAQSNIRDFGPPTYRRGASPDNYAVTNYAAASYAAPGFAAYATPIAAPNYSAGYSAGYSPGYSTAYSSAAYQPIAVQPVPATASCAASGYAPPPYNPYAAANYTAGYAPAPVSNASYWSSTYPLQYTGKTLFGTNTIYGKDQPVRNIGRFFIP